MPAFAFETITAAQAASYSAVTDSLSFAAGVTARSTAFVFNADGSVSATAGGRSVVFGAGVYGETDFIFQDGTRVVLGSPGNDLLVGAGGNDAIFGGPGDDTLAGLGGADLLVGGAGNDLYMITSNARGIVDTVGDWEAGDRLALGAAAGHRFNYTEFPKPPLLSELTGTAQGGNYVVYTSPTGYTYVGTIQTPNGIDITSAAILNGRTLADIDYVHIAAMPQVALPPLAPVRLGDAPRDPLPFPVAPPAPPLKIGLSTAAASVNGDMDTANFFDVVDGEIVQATASRIHIKSDIASFGASGSGYEFNAAGDLTGGRTTSISFERFTTEGRFRLIFDLVGEAPALPATNPVGAPTQQLFAVIFGGDDAISGGAPNTWSMPNDLLRGYAGDDVISGNGGNDTIYGGAGDDIIYAGGSATPAPGSATYLRGDEGDDFIVGGGGFDDINGNMGADTADGRGGDDWVVGGKDNDLLYGGDGHDLVYGNLGNDSCDGGAGNDVVRGGQGDDMLRGGDGADFLSGDRGDDTMTGGAGADTFNTFSETGIDRVTDFSAAQGDKVQLAPGTQYTLAQVGADTVINMVGGGQMILVGVQMSSLPAGWIFGA